MAPFPVLPVLIITLGQLSQYYFWTSPFVYAGFMVRHLGVVDNKDQAEARPVQKERQRELDLRVGDRQEETTGSLRTSMFWHMENWAHSGYYAGMIASSFSLGRIVGAYFWGLVADRHGRVLVMQISLCSFAICSVGFGFSTTLQMAICIRFVAGALTGQSVAGKSLVSEVCGEEHEVVGMSVVITSWSLGLSICPGVAGLLAEPATYFPGVFSQSGLFGRFPYLLPNLAGAGLAIITLSMTSLFLARDPAVVALRNFRPDPLEDDMNIETPSLVRDRADTSVRTPSRTPRGARSYLYTPGRTFCPSPSSVGDQFDTRGARNRLYTPGRKFCPSPSSVGDHFDTRGHESRRSASLDFSAAGINIPPSAPRPPKKTMTEPSRQPASPAEDEGRRSRSVAGCHRLKRNVVRVLRPRSLLANANVRSIVGAYAIHSFVYAGLCDVFPLWALSSVARGGLEWSTKDLAQLFFPCGVSMLIFQLIVIPCVTKRIGITTSQRLASVGAALSVLAIPLVPRSSGDGAPSFWVILVVFFSAIACFSVISLNMALAINNCVDLSRRGEVNGLATTYSALTEGIGPVFFSVVFAASINNGNPFPFDFHLVYLLMAVLMVLVIVIGWHSIKTAHDGESFLVLQGGSNTDEAETAAESEGGASPESADAFPVSVADSAAYV